MNPRTTLSADFLLRAEDLVAQLDFRVARLRAAFARADGRARRTLVEDLFRFTHTLKGSAATFDEHTVARIAYELENALHALRRFGSAKGDDALASNELGDTVSDVLQEAVDTIGVRLRSLRDDVYALPREEIEHAAETVAARLQDCTARLAEVGDAATLTAHHIADPRRAAAVVDAHPNLFTASPAAWRGASLDEFVAARLHDVLRDAVNLYDLEFNFELATFDLDYVRCESMLREGGEIILARPLPPPRLSSVQFVFGILYAAALSPSDLTRLLANDNVHITCLRISPDETNSVEADSIETDAAETDTAEGDSEASAFVRVPLDALDELVHLVGELHDASRAFANHHLSPTNEGADKSHEINARRRLLDVQERLLRMRMVPLDAILREAARAGRVAARANSKRVAWQIDGGEVCIDKPLAETIAAALPHLVRNAVDHGIEHALERSAAGKPEQGTIRIQATTGGGRVRVRVADDGRGIEPERVRAAALKHRIISTKQQLSEREQLRLIFRPGFTTADAIAVFSAVSGRGVGLNAAERALLDVGGELRVASAAGQGTTFDLRLPTTLLVLEAWIVQAESGAAATAGKATQRYCIPAEQVLAAVHLEANQITQTNDAGLRARWLDHQLPLVALSSLLGGAAPPHRNASGGAALVLRIRGDADEATHENLIMLQADECDAPRELFVRGLGAHAPRWRGVVGATALSDGAVALLLDVAELIEDRKEEMLNAE